MQEFKKIIKNLKLGKKQWLDMFLIASSFLLGIYLNFELSNLILFVSIIAALLFQWQILVYAIFCLVLLTTTSLASFAHRLDAAQELAVWFFYFCLIFIYKVIAQKYESKNSTKKDT